MSNRSRPRLSRGDRRRNEKLARLRAIITRETAVLAFDLASDKQVCALTDPDSRVLARRTARVKAWQLAQTLDWGLTRGGRGRVHLGGGGLRADRAPLAGARPTRGRAWGESLVCVQPLLVARAREAEDFTRNKNDDTDATIIARLVTELRCYLPERADPAWARLRHLGARRARLVVEVGAARQQVRDLLECAWPAVLDAASKPLDSANWLTAVATGLDRVAATGELGELGQRGWEQFAAAVRAELAPTRWYSVIVRAVFDAATDPAAAAVGVVDQRAGALERVRFALADLAHLRAQIAEVETRMTRVLDALGLTELVTGIPGVSAVGAATILAEAGDPTRFSSARALVKHAGLCPRANESGNYAGTTSISGRGRPELRLAAWRAVFTALQHNPVLAARHAHLTGRADNPLTDTQARIAVAATLLRQLHAVIVTRTAWNAAVAAGLDRREDGAATAA